MADELQQLFQQLGINDYLEKFRKEKIEIKDLVNLDADELKELIPELGPRKRLKQHIDATNAAGSGQSAGAGGAAVAPAAETKAAAPPVSGEVKLPAPSTAPADGFRLIPIAKNTEEFAEAEDKFKAALNNQISCHTKDRTSKGLRPVTFRLTDVCRVHNPPLAAAFAAARERMRKAGRDEAELRIRRGFHGSADKNMEAIAKNGLLRIGHPLNPSKSTDPGYFGDPRTGVYLSCNPDYCLKYSNGGEPLSPGEDVRILMFDVCPGRSFHVLKMDLGMQPKEGFDSHSSANHLEHFLFSEDQCLPTHILTVRAFENRRVDTDDETADLAGLPASDSKHKPAPAPAPAPAPPSASAATVATPPVVSPKPAAAMLPASHVPQPQPPVVSPAPLSVLPVTAAVAAPKPPAAVPAPVPVPVPAPKPEVKASSPAPAFATAKPGAQPKLLLSFGSEGDGPGQFNGPISGIAISPDNRIWVASAAAAYGTQGRVQVFGSDGEFLFAAEGQWKSPQEIAFDTVSGEAFIADDGGDCIVVCRLDGSFVREFGSKGFEQLIYPHGVAVDSKQGLVFVVEQGRHRVQVLNHDGSGYVVRMIGSHGSGEGGLSSPHGLCLTAAGELAVADYNNGRIKACSVCFFVTELLQVFGASGRFLREFGVGQLKTPDGICTDSAGNFLVADSEVPCVWVFNGKGTLVTCVRLIASFKPDGSGVCDVGDWVYSVCVDKDNRILVGGSNQRVQVLGFSDGTQAPSVPVTAAVAAPKPPAAVPVLPVPVPAPKPEVKASSPAAAFATAKPGCEPKLMLSFGSHGDGPGQFNAEVWAIAISPDNRIWVASALRVQVFSSDGKFLFAAARGQWKDPRGIAFDSSTGEAFISDFASHCVVVCRLDGRFVRKFGSQGGGNGQLFNPIGVAVDSKQGLVFVAEYSNSRVQVFNRDCSFVRMISGGVLFGRLKLPRGVCLTAVGELAVIDGMDKRIQVSHLCRVEHAVIAGWKVFDVNGKTLRKLDVGGQLRSPYGISSDSAGNFLVTDFGAGQVLIFDRKGAPVSSFGTYSDFYKMAPCEVGEVYSVCVDQHNRILVGGGKPLVQVLGFS